MKCRAVSYPMAFLPISMMLADGQGCVGLTAAGPLAELFCPVRCVSTLVSPPIVETLVAEPQATIDRRGSDDVASADNRARTAFELTMPQGHTLMVGLLGQARWSDGAQGQVGFYLVVQHWIDQEWQTIGSDGVSGSRTGESHAQGRAVVPVRLGQAGMHHLRAIVRSVAAPSQDCDATSCPNAEDRDIVEIDIRVLAGQDPALQPVGQPPIPQIDGWLQPDPPRLDEMLP